ncbi:MAG: hypothetical protein J6S99_07835 [Bacteroidales bacterium]|nr:hypothetical protein [Bacteroidales bacterium]
MHNRDLNQPLRPAGEECPKEMPGVTDVPSFSYYGEFATIKDEDKKEKSPA